MFVKVTGEAYPEVYVKFQEYFNADNRGSKTNGELMDYGVYIIDNKYDIAEIKAFASQLGLYAVKLD